MNIGIVGTGSMGRELSRLWAGAGHSVFIGSRDPTRGTTIADEIGRGAAAGTFAQAAAFGRVVLLAVANTAVFDVLAMLGDLRGKIIIDCNNPFDAETGLVQEAYRARSMAEAIAEAAPGVNVVKAYNTIPSAVLAKDPPRISGQITTTFLCGDDAEAKARIATLSRDAGLDPLDCGPLERARLVEAAAALMINFIFGGAGPNIALNLTH